jgi:hypothetical protein
VSTFILVVALGGLLAQIAGCADKGAEPAQDLSALKGQSEGVFDTQRSRERRARARESGEAETGSWSIALGSIGAGPTSQVEAMGTLNRARELGLASARLERRGDRTMLMYGAYRGPDDPSAAADLARVRGLTMDGMRPFGSATLTPPMGGSLAGAIPEYDLGTARRRFGDRALYTLQVGVYQKEGAEEPTDEELDEIRGAAEKAALDLRRMGEEAFYYHGPRRSTVTVGLLGEEDAARGGVVRDSPKVRELQRKHPLNLVNGQGVRTRVKGQTEFELQKSFLVAIPE